MFILNYAVSFSQIRKMILCGLIIFLGLFSLTAQTNIEALLQAFTDSYRNDPMALTVTFGINVDDQWWHVKSKRHQEGYPVGKSGKYTFHHYGPHEVTLHRGKPEEPTWYFSFANADVLIKIANKEWTAATAAARSMPGDKVGLDILPMEEFRISMGEDARSYQVLEHFWKKDEVEITTFARDQSLPSHGAAMVGLYTMKDKRIGWFSLGQDEAANADRRMDKGQVPNLFIFTKGKGKGHFGDQEIDIEPGMSVFIGPYVKHVVYNPYEEPLEGIIVLFGDNIDFAKGQSYLDFLDQEYEFLDANEASLKQQP